MKRFSQLMPAGVPVEFDYPARSFTLLGCITPVDVRFGTGSQTQEIAESMTPGMWYEAETPFRKVVITSPVDQVVSFLVSMGRSGWALPAASINNFETDLSGLAASAFAYSPIVDLGEDWGNATLNNFFLNTTASAGAVLSIRCAMDAALSVRSLAIGRSSTNNQAYMTSSSTNGYLNGMVPTGRYVRSEFQNGATIQGAGGVLKFQVMRNQP